ncbi:Alpha/Beta hydrolase protein [Daldinia caldariorum]|uniref:Alpha/Beta hydrolase protein n=1 Tax=Daldinia caldariorum TaxID=326644 RepID=UPI0020086406|nr:Alpha/Beta hydrolase protein [Daldinia caldariorum]KAI1472487.1 Alpha/Beta hydrolase protein [Daldinia caldariorum]
MSLSRHLPGSRRAVAVASGLVSPPPPPSSSSLPNSNTTTNSTTSTASLLQQPVQPRSFASQSNIRSRDIPHKLTLKHACKMSTMPAQHGHSEACCNIPPVVSKGYTPKGTYEELGGLNSYVTGPQEATKGIITIFDIFGFYPQTLQGADILATSDHSQKYRVFIPDWFAGEPAPLEWFPPDTEEKQKNLGAFFQKHSPPSVADKVPGYVSAVAAKYPQIKSWAILGFCWGGKVVSLVVSKPDTVFKAAVEAHPAMVDPADAANIKVPLALLASKDENPEDVKKFEQNLKVPKYVEIFGDQIHGWMAARSNLDDERVRAEYVRGYETVLKFLSKYL